MVQKYQALVYTVCHQLVPDVQEAQDLTQETFLAAWRAIDRCPPGFEKRWLARIAAKEAGIEGLDEILSGPTAITFVKGDFIEAAKVIRDFAKDNKALVIKGAAADGTVYDAEGAKKLADLKSRPQLLAEFAGDIKASMAKAAYLFNALPTKAVRTIDALREKQEKAA